MVHTNRVWGGGPGRETKMLQAKNELKVDDFEPIYLDKYRFWWNMICAFWAHYQSPFVWLCLFTPNLNTIFLLYCLLLFFLSCFTGYLLLKRKTHCIQSLSDWRYQGGLVREWHRGCQVWGSPSIVSNKIWTFKPLKLHRSKFWNK